MPCGSRLYFFKMADSSQSKQLQLEVMNVFFILYTLTVCYPFSLARIAASLRGGLVYTVVSNDGKFLVDHWKCFFFFFFSKNLLRTPSIATQLGPSTKSYIIECHCSDSILARTDLYITICPHSLH